MYLALGFLAQVTIPLKGRNVASCGEGTGLQGQARPATGRVNIDAARVEGSIQPVNGREGN